MNPLVIIAVVVSGVILFRYVIKTTEKQTREDEEKWANRQFARILAKRTTQSEQILFESLERGKKILPPDFKNAVLQYELQPSAQGQKRILKTLIVSFADAESSVQKTMEWLDLPAEIRNEILNTGQPVQRGFSW